MDEIISERAMLADMDSGRPFSIIFVTYDRRRKTGGRVDQYAEARLTKPQQTAEENNPRPLTPAEATRLATLTEGSKNPRHRRWYTRNLVVLQDGMATSITRKFHPPLVLQYNGKRVVV